MVVWGENLEPGLEGKRSAVKNDAKTASTKEQETGLKRIFAEEGQKTGKRSHSSSFSSELQGLKEEGSCEEDGESEDGKRDYEECVPKKKQRTGSGTHSKSRTSKKQFKVPEIEGHKKARKRGKRSSNKNKTEEMLDGKESSVEYSSDLQYLMDEVRQTMWKDEEIPKAQLEYPITADAQMLLNNIGPSMHFHNKKELCIVLDTNLFLLDNHLLLTDLKNELEKALGNDGFLYIVPWIVILELDHIKDRKGWPKKAIDLGERARGAVSIINQWLVTKTRNVIAQHPRDSAKLYEVIDGLTVQKNDDKLLHACIRYKQKCPSHTVVLLTLDKNLRNKSIIMNVKSLSVKAFQLLLITSIAPGSNAKASTDGTPEPSRNQELIEWLRQSALNNSNLAATKMPSMNAPFLLEDSSSTPLASSSVHLDLVTSFTESAFVRNKRSEFIANLALENRIDEENRVNAEIESFLRTHIQKRQDLLQYWIDKHENDVDLKQKELDLLKSAKAKDFERLQELKRLYNEYEQVVIEDRVEKEKIRRKAEQEADEQEAAILVGSDGPSLDVQSDIVSSSISAVEHTAKTVHLVNEYLEAVIRNVINIRKYIWDELSASIDNSTRPVVMMTLLRLCQFVCSTVDLFKRLLLEKKKVTDSDDLDLLSTLSSYAQQLRIQLPDVTYPALLKFSQDATKRGVMEQIVSDITNVQSLVIGCGKLLTPTESLLFSIVVQQSTTSIGLSAKASEASSI